MRTPFVVSIALTATAPFGATPGAADLFDAREVLESMIKGATRAQRFDAPGPGYREQFERFAPLFRRDASETYRLHTGVPWIMPSLGKESFGYDDLSLAPAPSRQFFSEPIRLFENPSPHPIGFSFAVPLSLAPERRQ